MAQREVCWKVQCKMLPFGTCEWTSSEWVAVKLFLKRILETHCHLCQIHFMKLSFSKLPKCPSASGEDGLPIWRQKYNKLSRVCFFNSSDSLRIGNAIVLLKVFRILAKYQATPQSPYANFSWWVNYTLLLLMGGISPLCSWRVRKGKILIACWESADSLDLEADLLQATTDVRI